MRWRTEFRLLVGEARPSSTSEPGRGESSKEAREERSAELSLNDVIAEGWEKEPLNR
jgi:hypothetical protein